jgi:hypothetical protein
VLAGALPAADADPPWVSYKVVPEALSIIEAVNAKNEINERLGTIT